jgi:RNA polymerase sigma factor (sigma-70 family)
VARLPVQEEVVSMEYTEQDILDNMGLVVWVAQRLRGRLVNHFFDFDDLISEGTFGLIKALDRFDTSQGHKFSAYGVPMIKGAMYRGARNANKQHWNAHARGVKVVTFSMHRTYEDDDSDVMRELNDDGKAAAESLDSVTVKAVLRRLKKGLTPRQYDVAELMIGGELNQAEIARELGLTRQAVHWTFGAVENKARRIFSEDLRFHGT